MAKFLIYALQDPFTYEIRYIGLSSSGLQRPRTHMTPGVLKKSKYPVHCWIASCKKKGKTPKILTLQNFNNKLDLYPAEIYWISYFKSIGSPLLNLSKGGDAGSAGYKWTQEQKDNRISKGFRVDHLRDPINIEKRNEGRKIWISENLDYFKSQVSNGIKEWWKNLDNETKLKINTANIGRPAINRKSVIDSNGNIFPCCKFAAEYYKITEGSIRKCIIKKYQHVNGVSFKYKEIGDDNICPKFKPSKKSITDNQISIIKETNSKKIIDNNGVIYSSITKASNILNICRTGIGKSIRLNKEIQGFRFKYV
jgi:hypothetical protein